MPTREELIAELEEAIGSGVKNTEYNDHKFEYQSVDQMLKALQLLKGKQTSPKPILQWAVARTHKGL